jgi:hypothetical protein
VVTRYARRVVTAATWRPLRPTWPASPTRWALSSSRSWAIPAGPLRAGLRRAAARAGPGRGLRLQPGSPPRQGPDWFAGMGTAGAAELRAATRGRAALEEHLASAEYDPELFTPADHAALAGPWSWLLTVVEQAMDGGLGGMVDDDLACVAPGGSTPGRYARRCCSYTAARIGWCPARTAGGWPARPLRRSCGFARTTVTSRSCMPAMRPLAGCGSTPAIAELTRPSLGRQQPLGPRGRNAGRGLLVRSWSFPC